MKRILLTAICLLAFALPFLAQTADQKTPEQQAAEQRRARLQAHQGDFDYLLGDWEWTGKNAQYGPIHGVWSASRMARPGQVLDEYRVTGDHGETYVLTWTLRSYNAFLDRWELIGFGDSNGLQNFGTGQRKGDEVFIEQKFGVGSPNPSTWRIHYWNIKSDSFSWAADVSRDDGKSWTKDYQTLEAHRTGPARTIGEMTTVKKPSVGSRSPVKE